MDLDGYNSALLVYQPICVKIFKNSLNILSLSLLGIKQERLT